MQEFNQTEGKYITFVNLDGKQKDIKPSLTLSEDLDRAVYQENGIFENLVRLTLIEEGFRDDNTNFIQ